MLEGVKVVEMAAYIAGPVAAGMMCDWGADVIKVEAPGGDAIRWNRPALKPGGWNPTFDADNRGKRSIVVDLRKPEGASVLRKLIEGADVFITSLRPRILSRAGFDYESVRAWKPDLIYASVTGYGLTGPFADTPAFDITAFWARSGIAGQMTPATGAPPSGRAGMGDHITGLSTALGVMTALFTRTRTGKGQLVESSLLRTGAHILGYDLSDQIRRGETTPAPHRGHDGRISVHYRAAAGRWFCIWAHDLAKDWPIIFRAAGRPDLAEDDRMQTPEGRDAHAAEVMAALEAGFAKRELEDIGRDLEAEGLIWSPVLTAGEVLADPAHLAAGNLVEMDDGEGGTMLSPAGPVRFPGAESGRKGASPSPGQHTDAILGELGYGARDIAAMRQAQAVG